MGQALAIATLARMGHEEAADDIHAFTESDDLQVRIFANRALAELGEPADREFLLDMLESDDHVLRQESTGALAHVEGEEVSEALGEMAEDSHQAVRIEAEQALIQREMEGRSPAEKLEILQDSLEDADRRRAPWIVETMLEECGAEGRAYVEELAQRDDRVGDRARTFLLWNEAQ